MMLDVGPFMPGGHQPPQQPPRLERVHIVATRPYAAARVNVQGLPRIIGGQAVAFRLTGGGALAFHLVSQEDATATRRAIKRGDLADVPDVLSRRPGFVFLDDGPGAGGGGGDGGGPDNGGGGGLSCASIEALQARVVAALEPASRSGGAFMDRLAQPERSTAGVSLVTPQHGVPLYAAALGTLTYADVSQHLPADWEPEAELIEVVRGGERGGRGLWSGGSVGWRAQHAHSRVTAGVQSTAICGRAGPWHACCAVLPLASVAAADSPCQFSSHFPAQFPS